MTRNPELSKASSLNFSGNAFTRFARPNNEKTGHVDFNLGGTRFGSLTSFTYCDFDDLRMGEKTNKALGEEYWVRYNYAECAPDNSGDVLVTNSDPYVQKFSGYKQYDLLKKFLFKQSDRVQHVLNFQYSTSSNVPRYDRLTDPQGSDLRSAEWYYGPQKRLLTSYQLKVNDLGKLADALTVTASDQDIEESRHDRRFNNNNLNHRTEKINVGGLTIDLQKKIKANQLRYGFDSQFNSLNCRPGQELHIGALAKAINARKPAKGLIHHTDRGPQYRSVAYRALLARHGLLASMNGRKVPQDNAIAESFFSTLKNELIHHVDLQTREQAKALIVEYIERFYNRIRIHQSLGYRTPEQYEKLYRGA